MSDPEAPISFRVIRERIEAAPSQPDQPLTLAQIDDLVDALDAPPQHVIPTQRWAAPFHQGQLVDMTMWNATASPGDRYDNPCEVRSCLPAASESGWMVEVAETKPTDRPGCPVTRCIVLDAGWLTPYFKPAGKAEDSTSAPAS